MRVRLAAAALVAGVGACAPNPANHFAVMVDGNTARAIAIARGNPAMAHYLKLTHGNVSSWSVHPDVVGWAWGCGKNTSSGASKCSAGSGDLAFRTAYCPDEYIVEAIVLTVAPGVEEDPIVRVDIATRKARAIDPADGFVSRLPHPVPTPCMDGRMPAPERR